MIKIIIGLYNLYFKICLNFRFKNKWNKISKKKIFRKENIQLIDKPNLDYIKLKYFNYKLVLNYKLFI